MAKKFIPSDEQDAKPTAEILSFPSEVIVQHRLRMMQAWVSRLSDTIETSEDGGRSATAEAVLPMALEDLRKAEAAVDMLHAEDTLKHKGLVYRAHASIAGAN